MTQNENNEAASTCDCGHSLSDHGVSSVCFHMDTTEPGITKYCPCSKYQSLTALELNALIPAWLYRHKVVADIREAGEFYRWKIDVAVEADITIGVLGAIHGPTQRDVDEDYELI